MSLVAEKLFSWSQTQSTRNLCGVDLVIPSFSLPNVNQPIRNTSLHIGSCRNLRAELSQFLLQTCKRITNVHLSRRNVAGIDDLCGQMFLQGGDDQHPAMAWASEISFNWKTVENLRRSGRPKFMGVFYRRANDPIRIPYSQPDAFRPLHLVPKNFDWSCRGETESLSLLQRPHSGSEVMRRRPVSLGLLANSNDHREYFRETDFFPAHDDAICWNQTPHMVSHSANPFVAVGRMRRELSNPSSDCDRTVFDYVLLTFDRDGGLISVVRQSVSLDNWLAKKPTIDEALRREFWPGGVGIPAPIEANYLLTRIQQFLEKLLEVRMGDEKLLKDGRHPDDIIDQEFKDLSTVALLELGKTRPNITPPNRAVPDNTQLFYKKMRGVQAALADYASSPHAEDGLFRVYERCQQLDERLNMQFSWHQ